MEQINMAELKSRLAAMSSVDITEIDPYSLCEIKDLKLNRDLSVEQRVLSLIEQTGNPYAYLDSGVVVKISFTQSGKSFQSCMEDYLVSEILPNA